MSDDRNDLEDTRDEEAQNLEDLDETWRVVRTVGTEEEAQVAAGFLTSAGIPAQVESLYVSELPVDLGDLSEVRIRVPVERASEALALLEAQDEAAPVFEEGEALEATAEPEETAPRTETK